MSREEMLKDIDGLHKQAARTRSRLAIAVCACAAPCAPHRPAPSDRTRALTRGHIRAVSPNALCT